MSVIAIIPAKGKSERVPGKNYRHFMGRPMMEYPIEAARRSRLFDKIVVSSESPQVLSLAVKLGVTAKPRPVELTLDHIGPLEVAQHAIQDWPSPLARVCVIYPTACMLEPEDLHRGYHLLRGRSYAISVNSDPEKPLQDAAMFIWCRAVALRTGMPLFTSETALVPIPKERVCDINLESDWDRAERMYATLQGVEA